MPPRALPLPFLALMPLATLTSSLARKGQGGLSAAAACGEAPAAIRGCRPLSPRCPRCCAAVFASTRALRAPDHRPSGADSQTLYGIGGRVGAADIKAAPIPCPLAVAATLASLAPDHHP